MADSVVVADNVELVASNIQSKVGATLLGTKAVVEDTKQTSGPSMGVLGQIKEFVSATADNVQAVWDLLHTQLEFQQDRARREDEQHAEWLRENGPKKGIRGGNISGIEKATDKAGFSTRIMDMLGGSLATLFTLGTLKLMVGKIFRVGFFLTLAAFAGDALIEKLNIEEQGTKDAIKLILPAAAVLFGVLRFKTAMLMIVPLMIGLAFKSVLDWLKGDKIAAEVGKFEWGAVALTGPALMLVAKYAGLLGVKGGILTIGGLMVGWPVVIAASIALALAAGVGYLFSQVSKVEQKMLDHLKEVNEMTQQKFDQEMAESKADIKSKIFGPALYNKFGGDTTLPQEIQMATAGALDLAKLDDPKKFPKEKQDLVVENMQKMENFLMNMDPQLMLDDEYKITQIQKALDNVFKIAMLGKLGDKGDETMLKVEAMKNHIQGLAKDIVDQRPDEATNFVIDVAKNRNKYDDTIQSAVVVQDNINKYKTEAERLQKRKEELLAIPKKERGEEWGTNLSKTKLALNIATGRYEAYVREYERGHRQTLEKFKNVVKSGAIEQEILSYAKADKKIIPIKSKKIALVEDKVSGFDNSMAWLNSNNKQMTVNKNSHMVALHHAQTKVDRDLEASMAQTG